MEPKISIICPIYKAEKYIDKCIKSIQHQSFKEWELILVDDGSPDSSGKICDEYACNDNRIKVIHKQNSGVSDSRQVGIDVSQGEYTIHVDPDDWIDINMLSDLYNIATNTCADMLICDFYVNTNVREIYVKQQPSMLNNLSVLKDLTINLHGSCCNKLIRRECYERYNVKFPKGFSYMEDLYVVLSLCQNPIKIEYLPKAYYHYNQFTNENSIVRVQSVKKFESIQKFINYFSNLEYDFFQEFLKVKKCAAKQIAYKTGAYSITEVKNIYPEVNQLVVKLAQKSVISNPDLVELAFALNHMWLIGKIYSYLFHFLSQCIKIIYKRFV